MAIEQAPAQPRKTARIVRWTILASILVFVTVLGVLHQRLGVGKPVGVDALCPFGGLETLGTLLTGGFLIKRVALSSVLLLGASIATALVFRRAFCGRICPLGYLQELFGGLGRRIFKRRPTVPTALDRPARYLKYVVLAAILWLTWATADLIIRPYDPWATYQHLSSPELLTEFGIGFAVLGVSLAGSLLYDRFFCKYACPMGAFLGLISRFSLFKIHRDAETCIDCKLCDRACPVNVEVSTAEVVTSPECIDCGECVTACPVRDALQVRTRTSPVLNPLATGVYAVGLFALLVAVSSAVGAFEWTMPTLADSVEDAASSLGLAPSEVPFDSSLIKGSTTMSEIVEATGIPSDVFTQVYGIPASEQTRQLKDLKTEYSAYPGDVRAFVDAYLADPAAASTYVPGSSHEEEEDH
jgi:polyferredoxin